MKKGHLFAGLCIALTVSSCQKNVDTAYSASLQTDNSSLVAQPSPKIQLFSSKTNYGALIDVPDSITTGGYDFSTSIAGQLGISCIRERVPVPQGKKVALLSSSYNILLNFNSSGMMPMPFRTDVTTYQNQLKNILSSFTALPAVAVIENEESNSKYYRGSAAEYINQLKAAIPVMHSYHIPVANGGITSSGLKYLVYQDYVSRGMIDEANSYRMRMKIALKSPEVQERAAFIQQLLNSYATMDLDYVNFHWRSQIPDDAQASGETIDYLQRVTGKPVITNEIGQYDTNPATLTTSVQKCSDYKMPYVIWYSDADGKSTPLHNPNRTLTLTGNTYHDFINH